MNQKVVPAVFMRGGASKALLFHRSDLPVDRSEWAEIFLAAMGSPDPNRRQLDGMGGGISSLSKVCIVGPSKSSGADVDYIFGQVEVSAARVDYSGSCGSMASAIGPFAADEGIVNAPRDGKTTVRIRDVNTERIILSRFEMRGGSAAVAGDVVIEGVSGSGAPVDLEFLAPGGAETGKLLPTGNVVDEVEVPGAGPISYSLVDATKAVVFISAGSIGLTGAELPQMIEKTPSLLDRIEAIRRHIAVKVGFAPSLEAAGSIARPRIAFVARSSRAATLSGRVLEEHETDIMIRMIGRGVPHRAVPVTTALCLAVACGVEGSIPNRVLRPRAATGRTEIVIGHPSGAWAVCARMRAGTDPLYAELAGVRMTARRLFQGGVLVPHDRIRGKGLSVALRAASIGAAK